MSITTIMVRFKKIRILFLISLFIVLSGCLPEQQSTSEFDTHADAIDHYVKDLNSRNVFNGTILVIEDGDIIYEGAHGYADFETRRKLDTDTDFYLASVSKQFTSMAIMILKEDGLLTYEDSLTKYFPNLPTYANDVTIRHLMTHTSGIPDHFSLGSYKPGLTNNDVLDILFTVDNLDFASGSQFAYSNSGYVLLAMVAERAAGQPYHQFMKERIFDPLEMERTLIYDESKPEISNRALGFNPFNEKDDYDILTTGAGGMFSNVRDLARWEQALYTDKLVSEQTLHEAYFPYTLNDGSFTKYGFGWSLPNDSIVTHSGGLSGYRTFMGRNIKSKDAIIFLTNNGDAVAFQALVNGVNNILQDKPTDKLVIPLTIALSKSGITDISEMISYYWELKENHPDGYDFGEDQLNTFGYHYLDLEMFDEAIAIFKLNIEMYPDAFNPYDSLGEAYYLAGEYDLSIKYYQKSIDLNPDNMNGREMLRKARQKLKEMKVLNA